jgi:hypothetical protein
MKDHKKNIQEIQEREYREAEEKRTKELEKIETEKKIKGKGKEKENNEKILNSLSDITMSTPTLQDFYHLQEQLMQMQQMMSQLANTSQLSTQAPQSNFDVVRLFLKLPTTLHNKHNPQKLKLLFDGSNYQQWENKVNQLLSCIFEMETSFVDNAANFITHGN